MQRAAPHCTRPLTAQEIFALFIASFDELADPTAPHFRLSVSVLETIGQVCVRLGR